MELDHLSITGNQDPVSGSSWNTGYTRAHIGGITVKTAPGAERDGTSVGGNLLAGAMRKGLEGFRQGNHGIDGQTGTMELMLFFKALQKDNERLRWCQANCKNQRTSLAADEETLTSCN